MPCYFASGFCGDYGIYAANCSRLRVSYIIIRDGYVNRSLLESLNRYSQAGLASCLRLNGLQCAGSRITF